jgi:hypothetical protein|tara:strand:- start:3564 stop:3686 length:123 start_codon:yes stop_codon:yes gene_type:complete
MQKKAIWRTVEVVVAGATTTVSGRTTATNQASGQPEGKIL